MYYHGHLNKENREKKKQILEKECSKFFNLLKKKSYVFRGIENLSSDFKKVKARKNRQPRDTPSYVHEKLDEMFQKHFGWKVRSEGVFTSGNSELEDYGDIFLFAPIGNFKYIWSANIKDLYHKLLTMGAVPPSRNIPNDLIMDMFDKRSDEVEDLIKKYHHNEGLNIATRYETEIVFKCDYYYLLNVTDENYEIYDELSK
jgi:hypothetical protein